MNTEENQIPSKPSDRISVVVNGEVREVFMSGGLLRNVIPYYMDLGGVADIFNQPFLQNDVIVQCLKPRTPRGIAVEVYTIDDFEMTIEESNKLIAWTAEHAIHYFIESVTTAHQLGQRNEDQLKKLQKLMESMNGTQDSQQ